VVAEVLRPTARHAAERAAQNTPMQGAGADIIKLAMLATAARIAREKWPVKMLLTVHDELVFESPPDIAEAVGAALKQEMESVYQLSVPLEVDIGIGIARLAHRPTTERYRGRMGAEALQFLLLGMAGWINRRQLEVIDYLKEEDRAFASSWAGGGCGSSSVANVSVDSSTSTSVTPRSRGTEKCSPVQPFDSAPACAPPELRRPPARHPADR
jgi:hypothetical protein